MNRSWSKSPVSLVLLMVLDGWGINPRSEANAIAMARTPVMDSLLKDYPHSQLIVSGEAVGLPEGQMGNSEVGHMNIGAGRVVYQELTQINRAIRTGQFFNNRALNEAMEAATSSALHLMGLVSDGGVHSHTEHWYATLNLAREKGLRRVYLHPFLDGRDTSPTSGAGYIRELQGRASQLGIGTIATVAGRYYAMDRDKRWERMEKAYRAISLGEGPVGSDPEEVVKGYYEQGVTDEFIPPTIVAANQSDPYRGVVSGDAIIFLNFRADRARELTRAFTEEGFNQFRVRDDLRLSRFVCLTEYDRNFHLPVAFPPTELKGFLGEVLSTKGLRQLRIAETEKYAHITFFLNGGEEVCFPGEDRILIPSPRDVPTYDLKPQMSAIEVTDELVRRISTGVYHFIVVNYANPDMVGHTGGLRAAIAAIETVDRCIGRVVEAVREQGGKMVVTSDHGNAEQMIDYETGEPYTAHTHNPVPFIIVDDERKGQRLKDGVLADVAPTVLALMGIEPPEEMEGTPLLSP